MSSLSLPPRFLDTFQPVRRTDSNRDPVTALIDNLSVDENRRHRTTGGTDLSKIENQCKHYRQWVYVAIQRIADRVAAQKPQVSIKTKVDPKQQRIRGVQRQHIDRRYGYLQSMHEDLEPVSETHPFVRLLEDVNPYDTWYEFLFETLMYLELTGSVNWLTIPNSIRTPNAPAGLPSQLWVIPPHWIEPVYDDDGTLLAYSVKPYMDAGREQFFPVDWVVRAHDKNPLSKLDPYSPLEAGAEWIDNADSIEKSRRATFANGANPDLFLELSGDVYKTPGQPDKAQLDRIRARFRQRHMGLEKHSGEPIIAPPGIKPHKWSNTPREMDFGVSADQARDNNLALFATPPVIAGVSHDYNRATADAAMVAFCENKIEPRLRFIAGVLCEHLARRFDPRILVWYQDCTPENAEFQLKLWEVASRNGGVYPNDWRDKLGLERKEDDAYDTGYMPASMAPLDGRMEPEPIPEDDPFADADEDEEPEDGDDEE